MTDHQQQYRATWASLEQYTVPDWYVNAKFGIFIHWGVYAVPAFKDEWYSRNMYIQGSEEFEHHVATYGPHRHFGYKDFIPRLTGERFDPSEWVDLFRQAGARYVVPVAEHHDGFAMYDCSLSKWTAVNMGPKRDVIGELEAATRNAGLAFGVSSHRAANWWFLNGGLDFDSDVVNPEFHDFYGPPHPGPAQGAEGWKGRDWIPRMDAEFLDDWLARTSELVDLYQPDLLWFDFGIKQLVCQPYLQKFAAYYYNRAIEWDQEVVINYKEDIFPRAAAVYDLERGQLDDINPHFWQTDTSVSKNSWGYVAEQDYKTSREIVGDLVDVVSKNGSLLLNVGPRADGSIPEPEQQILRDIGAWLAVNGEAIYDSRPWHRFGEGPTKVGSGYFTDTDRRPFTAADFRFTTKGDSLYAVCLDWPGDGALIRSLPAGGPVGAEAIAGITMLGSDGQLAWTQDGDGLRIQPPAAKPGDHAYTFKIDCRP